MPYFALRSQHRQGFQPLSKHQSQESDHSQTPETQGSHHHDEDEEDELFPAYEIQRTSKSDVVSWEHHDKTRWDIAPCHTTSSAAPSLNPAVASAWLQMAPGTAVPPGHHHQQHQHQQQIVIPPPVIRRHPQRQPQPVRSGSGIFRRAAGSSEQPRGPFSLGDWFAAGPCSVPTAEPPTKFWSRRSRRRNSDPPKPENSGSLIPQHQPQQNICSNNFSRALRNPQTATTSGGGASFCHKKETVVTSTNHNRTTVLRPQASLFDSPSDFEVQKRSKPISSSTTSDDLNLHNQVGSWRKNRSSNNNKEKMSKGSSKWKTAVDPKSGKTYYYHIETRETQWRKPVELASAEEREAMEEKERRQRDFFAAMEANILSNLRAGNAFGPAPSSPMTKNEHNLAEDDDQGAADLDSSDDEDDAKQPRSPKSPQAEKPDLVRTISSMDERILRDLVMRVPSHHIISADLGIDSTSSPTEVATNNFPNSSSSKNEKSFVESDGSLEEMDLLEEKPRRAGSMRSSITNRQASLGTMLATLPEDRESNMDMAFSFGETSFTDMGLSEQESQALLNFAQVSSQMALMGGDSYLDESFGTLEEHDDEALESSASEEVESPEALKPEEDLDPLRNMSLEPTPIAGNKQMTRGSASSRLIPQGPAPVKPKVTRRNTCGTLYVGSTMSAPDIDATIKCVCGVFRAHILQAEMDPRSRYMSGYESFNDHESQQQRGSQLIHFHEKPTLDQVCAFYRDVFQRAQMESDCVIMSLIYVERLIKSTHGQLRPRSRNWRSVLFSSMVLASKVWDDLSMWNGDFSQTCPAGVKFTLQRINELELAVLDVLSYNVKVPASEYAKYYFLLRAMLIKSGLGGESLQELNPLDVEGARRLQAVSSKYQRAATLRQVGNATGPRSKSLNIEIDETADDSEDALRPLHPEPKGKVSLEHMVQM